MKKFLKNLTAMTLALMMCLGSFSNASAAKIVYVMMNVPYTELYATLNNDVAVDTVASATQYGANDYGTMVSEKAMQVEGVKVPVAMNYATYLTIKNKVKDETAAHYISEVLTETPDLYTTLTYRWKNYSFSSMNGYVVVVNDVEATISSDTRWGDYELDLADSSLGISASDFIGAVFHTEEGHQYAMRSGENPFGGHGENVAYFEFGWGTTEGCTDVKGNARASAHYASMEGETIDSVTYYSLSGIYEYDLANPLYVAPHVDSELSASIVDDNLVLAGVPEDAENATVSLYTPGGRGVQAVYYVQNEDYASSISFDTSALTDGTAYTVSVYTDNYAVMTSKVTYDASNTYVYGKMNLTFDTYAAALGLNLAASVDAVASPTTSSDTNYVVEDENGTSIAGVVVDVRMTSADYAALEEMGLTGEYAMTLSTDVPATYLSAAVANGAVTVSEGVNNVTTTDDVVATINSNSNWASYEVALADKTLAVPADQFVAAYLTTSDGTDYLMRKGENPFGGHGASAAYFEFGVATTENFKDVKGFARQCGQYVSMEGKTIVAMTFLTTEGTLVYNLPDPLYVAPHQEGAISASFVGEDTVAVTGIAADAQDVLVSIQAGGRNGAVLVKDAEVVDGTVTLTGVPTVGSTYNVVVTSSNYAASKTTVTANPMVVAATPVKVKIKATAVVADVLFADGYTVAYSSSDAKVVSVDENGTVTALRRGNAVITVTVADSEGNVVASQDVTVQARYIA